MHKTSLIISFLLIVFLSSCRISNKKQTGKLSVLATTGQIADALINIAGDSIDILPPLCGPGTDPHQYMATVKDIQQMQDADLIFYNGLHLEGQMENLLESLDNKSIAVAEELPKDQLIVWSNTQAGQSYDPHVWNDSELWIRCVQTITETLANRDTANAEYYRRNSQNYITKIRKVHEASKNKLEKIPKKNRHIVSSHDAFNYFARTYNFKNKAIMGISTQSEAGIKAIQQLADYIIEHQIDVVFMETMVNDKGVRALKEAVKAQGREIHIANQPLYSDALGDKPPANTYLGMMQTNVNIIYDALYKQAR